MGAALLSAAQQSLMLRPSPLLLRCSVRRRALAGALGTCQCAAASDRVVGSVVGAVAAAHVGPRAHPSLGSFGGHAALIHRTMLDDAEFQRILHVLQIAQVFGSANVFADAVSRGYFSIVEQLCRQVATRYEWLDTDGRILALLAELRVLALAQRTAADERAVSPPAKKRLKTRHTPALEQSRTAASSDSNIGDGPSTSQPAGQSSAEHDDPPSTAYPLERLVQCTTPGCDRACDLGLLRRDLALCCAICGVPHVRHTTICGIVHSPPLQTFALPLRRLEPRRPRRISDASVPRVNRLDLISNNQLPDLVAPPILADNLVEAARGIVWDLVVAPPIVAVDPFEADMPGGGPAMHPGAEPDVLIDYDGDDDDVWARVFGGPPLQTVSHTASTANAAVDAVSRRPLSPTELGFDWANPSNSMGDGPAQRPTAFPRFGTRGVWSPAVVVARPGQFLSFATPTPVPVLGGAPHRYRSPSPLSASSGQATRAPNVFPTFVPARSRRESRFPPSNLARQPRAQLSSATQASSRFIITPQQGPRPPPVSFAAVRPTVASPDELHVVPPARGVSSRPAPSPAQAARCSSLLDVLMSDTSRHMLCPNDPSMLAALVRDVGGVVDASVKANTAKKDRSAMRK